MLSGKNILVLDAGTTGVKGFVFDENEQVLARVNEALFKTSSEPGYVEQDPLGILAVAKKVLMGAVVQSKVSASLIIGFGITNQRETIIAWRTDTGEPLYPAIVWEDTRTKDWCDAVSDVENEKVRNATGLPIDSYFSASKIRWLLDNVSAVQQALEDKKLAVGTVDTWLMWNLLEDSPYVISETNAERTLLFNIKTREWDDDLLMIFNIPKEILPIVKRSQTIYGKLKPDIIGASVPLVAVCGDQQSSMYAAGSSVGTTKVTYGTGTFIMQIVGSDFVIKEPFFTTLTPSGDEPIYAIEAKIDRGGPEVEPLLSDTIKLEEFLKKLVQDVDAYIKQLPIKPQEIVIDGGVTRDGIIACIQPEITGIPARQHQTFDATALGTAKLAKEFLTKNPL